MERREVIMFIAFVFIIIIAAFIIFSVLRKQPDINLTESELGEINSISEEILQAINSGDYPAFSAHFSPIMKEALNESSFQNTRELILDSSGQYVSNPNPRITSDSGYVIFVYDSQFEKEIVQMRITFLEGSDVVEGLWFDSVNLRRSLT